MRIKRMTAMVFAAALIMTFFPSCASFADGGEKDRKVENYEETSYQEADYKASGGTVTEFMGTGEFRTPTYVNSVKITKIGEKACQNRQDIFFADTVNAEVVGDYAFNKSGLETLYIGENVKQIGMYAFSDCSKLSTVIYEPKKCVIGALAFSNTGNIKFFIPCTNDIESALDEIRDAKLDDNFTYDRMHYFVESATEKETDGSPVLYCSKCGEKYFADEGESGAFDDTLPFTDVSASSWYYDYVKTAYGMGIVNGKSGGRFDPDANMTLAEAAKIAALVHKTQLGEDPVIAQTGSKGYTAYVDYCYDNNIVEDYVKFDWTKPATRCQMAYIFSRADISKYIPNPDVPLTDIPDVHDTTPYAYEILDLYRKGIAVGSDAKYTFHPDNNIKRSEVSALVSRMIINDMRIELAKG